MSMSSPFYNNPFPERGEIRKNYQDALLQQVREIDIEKLDFESSDFKPRLEIKEKQKVYFWIRVYLNQEIDLTPDSEVKIKYLPGKEELITKFICYAKKNLNRDNQDEVVEYDSEDDKKCLCLMIDSDRINYQSSDIPFIRTLFKIGRFYQPQILSKNELIITGPNNTLIEYYDVDF